MIGREFKFHDGAKGSALAIRVVQKKADQQINKVLKDGTVVINLSPEVFDINLELISFLADALGVTQKHLDIIAGHEGNEKLLSILDMKPDEVQNSVLKILSI